MNKLFLSRHVIYHGEDRGLSVVELDAEGYVVSLRPFAAETAATVYIDRTLCLDPLPEYPVESEVLTIRDIIFGYSLR